MKKRKHLTIKQLRKYFIDVMKRQKKSITTLRMERKEFLQGHSIKPWLEHQLI